MVQLCTGADCTGCYACASICPQNCISFREDKEGFWYPDIDESRCMSCGLCEKVCPGTRYDTQVCPNKAVAYAAKNKNDTIRAESSSGGVFTLLAEYVLGQGGVVFGAAFQNDFQVAHVAVAERSELYRLRGSKYVQSRIGDTYQLAKTYLDAGRMVLFTGTPCQIAGLHAYLRTPYEHLYCQDLICHGVPSPMVWARYLNNQESKKFAQIKEVSFRNKSGGWKQFCVKIAFSDQQQYLCPFSKDPFMQGFLANVYLRPSCHACRYKTIERQADITLADFWGIQRLMPEMDDDRGTSLVILHSEKGRALMRAVRESLDCKPVDLQQVVIYNSAMIRSVAAHPKREQFFDHIFDMSFDETIRKYCAVPVYRKLLRKVKGAVRRIGRLVFGG